MAIVIRRGSTPEIKCYIPEDIDMSSIVNIWLYLTQNEHGKDIVKIDKLYDDIFVNQNIVTMRRKTTHVHYHNFYEM